MKDSTHKEVPESWERAKRMAFWDQGKFTYTQWISAIKKSDRSVIRQSVNYMRAADFIDLAGKKMFIKTWPTWRTLDSSLSLTKATILDAAWALFVVGDVSFPVDIRVTKFHSKKLSTLRTLIRSEGTASIYQLAKLVGRNYRRVHDDIKDFVEAGFVKVSEENRQGRVAMVAKVPGIHCL